MFVLYITCMRGWVLHEEGSYLPPDRGREQQTGVDLHSCTGTALKPSLGALRIPDGFFAWIFLG